MVVHTTLCDGMCSLGCEHDDYDDRDDGHGDGGVDGGGGGGGGAVLLMVVADPLNWLTVGTAADSRSQLTEARTHARLPRTARQNGL